MRSADVFPHSWEVTSDSIAAFVAGALDAARLILIKPATGLSDTVDPYFATTLPAGLPYFTIGWDRMDELAARAPRLGERCCRRAPAPVVPRLRARCSSKRSAGTGRPTR